MMKIPLAALFIVCSICNVFAEPGGTHVLTGKEKGIADIIEADMDQYPELYKGEAFNSYLLKFKAENKMGRTKYKPGDLLRFPETKASLQLKESNKPLSGEELLRNLLPKLRVESHTFVQRENRSGRAVYVAMDGKEIYSQNGGNLHMICIDPSGLVDSFSIPFQKENDLREYAQKMMERIESCPPDGLIILGVHDTAHTYSPYIRKISKMIGGKTDELSFRQSYVCIGYIGAKRGTAIEILGGAEPDEAAIYSGEKLEI